MILSRRGFIAGLFAAPIIVKAASLMPVRVLPAELTGEYDDRVVWQIRQEAMRGLAEWWAERCDSAMFNQLSGNTICA